MSTKQRGKKVQLFIW